jgi:hypothetical protein
VCGIYGADTAKHVPVGGRERTAGGTVPYQAIRTGASALTQQRGLRVKVGVDDMQNCSVMANDDLKLFYLVEGTQEKLSVSVSCNVKVNILRRLIFEKACKQLVPHYEYLILLKVRFHSFLG